MEVGTAQVDFLLRRCVFSSTFAFSPPFLSFPLHIWIFFSTFGFSSPLLDFLLHI